MRVTTGVFIGVLMLLPHAAGAQPPAAQAPAVPAPAMRAAQMPATPRPAAPPQGPGRRAVSVLSLTTAAWTDGGAIPTRHSQAGRDVSPPLAWSDVPDGTASFVLLVHDLDARIGDGTDDLLHWLVWNLPGTARSLPEGIPQGDAVPGGGWQISATGPSFRGPGAPAAGPAHHYAFELFALDTMLTVPAGGPSPLQTRAAVLEAMKGHIRAKGTLVGTFRRAP